jgi:hypothetical protein
LRASGEPLSSIETSFDWTRAKEAETAGSFDVRIVRKRGYSGY